MTSSPIQSFLSQTQSGDSRWWTWVIGFWFALVIWFYGQVILGGSMQVFAMLSDPEIMEKAMAMTSDAPAPNAKTASLYALLAISPLLPIILWCVRGSFKSALSRQITTTLSALIIAATTIVFIKSNMDTPDGAEEFVSALIMSHPVNYALIFGFIPHPRGRHMADTKICAQADILIRADIGQEIPLGPHGICYVGDVGSHGHCVLYWAYYRC